MDVTLAHADLDWTVRALIDTGAPYTLFDRGAGDALGVDFERSDARRRWHKISGGTYLAQVEMVHLTLPPFDDLAWETEVDFFRTDWGMPFAGLLGTEGFLDRWVVTFNRYENYFVVEEPDGFAERLPPDFEAEYEGRDLGWKT